MRNTFLNRLMVVWLVVIFAQAYYVSEGLGRHILNAILLAPASVGAVLAISLLVGFLFYSKRWVYYIYRNLASLVGIIAAAGFVGEFLKRENDANFAYSGLDFSQWPTIDLGVVLAGQMTIALLLLLGSFISIWASAKPSTSLAAPKSGGTDASEATPVGQSDIGFKVRPLPDDL